MSQGKPTLSVSIRELRDTCERVFEHLEKVSDTSEIELNANLYWCISRDRLFDLEAVPRDDELEVGDISSDWESVRRAVLIEGQPLCIHLAMVSTLLHAIGEEASRRYADRGG